MRTIRYRSVKGHSVMANFLTRFSVPVCQQCMQLMQISGRICTQRFVSTTNGLWRNMKWREREDIARSNEYGPFTDLRDWSYLDGRETPLHLGQARRKEEQREIAKRIDLLAGEMMKAVNDHKNQNKREEDEQIEKLAVKLKTKGSKYRKHDKLHRVLP